MLKPRMILLILAVLLLSSGVALAVGPDATMALERWVMGGGESARSAASLQIQATIGQPAASYSIAVPLALYWGYWGPQPFKIYLPLVLRK
jgi:hypothetical protein